MKKLRRTRFIDDDEAPPSFYRHHMPRREFVALGGHYEHRPAKPTKGERAALRRLRLRRAAQAVRYFLDERPRFDDAAWNALRAQVLAVGYCAWCKSTRRLTVDHIVPHSKGGPSVLSNLQCLCKACNKAKGDQTGIFSWT